jgi:cell division protein FtsB
MYWFLLFLAVVAVWLVVLALLARKLWGQTKALTRELAAAQVKLESAQQAGSGRTGPTARSSA